MADVEYRQITDAASYRYFLQADLEAHGVSRWSPALMFSKPCLYYQRLLRRVEYLQTKKSLGAKVAYVVTRFRMARLSVRTGISLPAGVAGPGLSLAHYGSIVVNPDARIGAFCRVHSAVNIGVLHGKSPRIGDMVYLGPGCAVFGDVELGDHVAVGANAVVNASAPAGSVLAGAPARVVSDKGSYDVMPAWFPPAAREAPREVG